MKNYEGVKFDTRECSESITAICGSFSDCQCASGTLWRGRPFVVGQYDDSASVAAVAIGSQVMQTITGIILGITTGTTVLIAIATGAKDDKKVAFTIGSSVWLFSIIGVLLTLVMVVFHGRIAELMHTPIEAMADTKSYILVCSAGILFIVGYNVVCGILRGLGRLQDAALFCSAGVCD